MSRETVFEAISGTVPCAHLTWGRGNAPALPWAVFYGRRADLSADDGNYQTVWRWTVELYQLEVDEALEDSLETALSWAFGYISRGEDAFIEEEGTTMTPFYFTEIEKEVRE